MEQKNENVLRAIKANNKWGVRLDIEGLPPFFCATKTRISKPQRWISALGRACDGLSLRPPALPPAAAVP